MRHAIKEVSDTVGAPVALAASAALGAVSLACQNFVNIQCPGFEGASCSLFLWTIAESSHGKSEVERRFLRAVLQFEEDERMAVDAGKSDFEADLKCWQDDERDLEKKYRKAQTIEEKEALKSRRRQHAKAKPQERRARLLRYTEMTPQQMMESLDRFGAIGIMCADAGDVVKLETFQQTTLLNGLWSGESRRTGRVGGDRAPEAPRLTISMMLQESEFHDFIRQRGRAAVGNGLWARFLIAQPKSFQTRGTGVGDERYLDEFNARIASILQQAVPTAAKRETLVLSKDAERYWTCYRDAMSTAAGDLRRTTAEKNFLLKLAQQASRIAALFHYFSRRESASAIADDPPEINAIRVEISAEPMQPPLDRLHAESKTGKDTMVVKSPDEISGQTMLDAITLSDWFMCEYEKVMSRQEPQVPSARRENPHSLRSNEEKLLGWIQRHYDRFAAEQNSECVKLEYAKFQNAFTRMGRGSILTAMQWLGQQREFRAQYGPRRGMYLCCSPSGFFCNRCTAADPLGQPGFSDERGAQYAQSSSFINGVGLTSLGQKDRIRSSPATSDHDAADPVGATGVVAMSKVNTGGAPVELQGRENQEAVDASRAFLDTWRDAAADELSD